MVVSAGVVAEFRDLSAQLSRSLGASALLVITDFQMCKSRKVDLGPGAEGTQTGPLHPLSLLPCGRERWKRIAIHRGSVDVNGHPGAASHVDDDTLGVVEVQHPRSQVHLHLIRGGSATFR